MKIFNYYLIPFLFYEIIDNQIFHFVTRTKIIFLARTLQSKINPKIKKAKTFVHKSHFPHLFISTFQVFFQLNKVIDHQVENVMTCGKENPIEIVQPNNILSPPIRKDDLTD